MMSQHNSGRLAIHRRSDEIAFLQHRLRTLRAACASNKINKWNDELHKADLQIEALMRERDLADELLHTRQTEPLGETLQRRLAMTERVCRDLAQSESQDQNRRSDAYRVAEIEHQALAKMLGQWWAWLRRS